jgi:hypothetical protein
LPTAGHTQLPGNAVAIVSLFGYLVRNTTSKRPEPATAFTGVRSGTLALLSSSSKLASVQHSLNFCLPAVSHLPHQKGMCLNAALNKIALKPTEYCR